MSERLSYKKLEELAAYCGECRRLGQRPVLTADELGALVAEVQRARLVVSQAVGASTLVERIGQPAPLQRVSRTGGSQWLSD